MKNLQISELEERVEFNHLVYADKEVIIILLAAINDWPNPVLSLEEYELDIKKLIKEDVTKYNVENYLLKIDFSKEAWAAESLTQLVSAFALYENKESLGQIIKHLKHVLLMRKN